MSDLTERYFTIEEANVAIEIIRPLMSEILEIRQNILNMQGEVWPVVEKALGNGGSRAASEAVRDFERLNDLVHQVQGTGAILKDVNSGLVDFLALREGRDVYLCWKYNEEHVEFWHDLDAGFAGRQRW